MNNITIPAPPQPTFTEVGNPTQRGSQRSSRQQAALASRPLAPLDAAFLGRVYDTMLWFGTLLTLCCYALTASWLIMGSFAGGALLAALLLKSQEVFVRRVIRPKDAPIYVGWDARLPLYVLLPGKYFLIAVAFNCLLSRHLLHPIGFAAGFIMIQTAIIAKVMGYMMAQRIRPVHEVNQVYGKQGTSDVA